MGAGGGKTRRTQSVRTALFGEKKSSECPPEVIAGLMELAPEYPNSGRYVKDMLMYAEIGRDRTSLTMEYVEKTREKCEEFEALLNKMNGRSPQNISPDDSDPGLGNYPVPKPERLQF